MSEWIGELQNPHINKHFSRICYILVKRQFVGTHPLNFSIISIHLGWKVTFLRKPEIMLLLSHKPHWKTDTRFVGTVLGHDYCSWQLFADIIKFLDSMEHPLYLLLSSPGNNYAGSLMVRGAYGYTVHRDPCWCRQVLRPLCHLQYWPLKSSPVTSFDCSPEPDFLTNLLWWGTHHMRGNWPEDNFLVSVLFGGSPQGSNPDEGWQEACLPDDPSCWSHFNGAKGILA